MLSPQIVSASQISADDTQLTAASTAETEIASVIDVQKYNRSIHIMAMLVVGFGFLMVFVKKYGLSAMTATYLLVSVSIPLYFVINSMGIFGEPQKIEIDRLILAEFAAASLLICAGAVLGRLKMYQYIIMGLLFIPCYMFNEWIVLDNGLGIIARGGCSDTGGSIIIHAFGALFGLGVAMTMTTRKEFDTPIESDATSDRFSMLGSMVLWLFWPSFCAALVAPADIPATVSNVVVALCGSTIATYFATVTLRRKICIADIANAALAGGVAIGSTCDHASLPVAFIIGILAGVLSTFGFAVIQNFLAQKTKKIDTCGVLNLHGLPGLMGGLAAIFVVKDINTSAHLMSIGMTIAISLIAGYFAGIIISVFGRRVEAYVDSEEFGD
ncbi:MAG: ammonium transporter [Planctomycetes bacterium]|nr:ammonium transporter [Planctomycetota bacterium]